MMTAQQPLPVSILRNGGLNGATPGWNLVANNGNCHFATLGGQGAIVFGDLTNPVAQPFAQVYQDIDLMAGYTYQLNFRVGQNGSGGSPALRLDINDLKDNSYLSSATYTPGPVSVIFTAKYGAARFLFWDQSTGNMTGHDVYLVGIITLNLVV